MEGGTFFAGQRMAAPSTQHLRALMRHVVSQVSHEPIRSHGIRTRSHTWAYTHTHTHTHSHGRTHTYTHMDKRMHARSWTNTRAHTYARTHTHAHALTHTRACSADAYEHACLLTCTQTHTHTHAHKRARTHACTHTHTHACTYAPCPPLLPTLQRAEAAAKGAAARQWLLAEFSPRAVAEKLLSHILRVQVGGGCSRNAASTHPRSPGTWQAAECYEPAPPLPSPVAIS